MVRTEQANPKKMTRALALLSMGIVSVSCAVDHVHFDVWQPFPVYKNISVFEKTDCREDVHNSLKWLSFANYQRCVIIVSDVDIPSCFFKQLEQNNITFIIRDENYMISRDILRKLEPRKFICGSYIMFTEKSMFIQRLFAGRKHFYPFAKIFLFVPISLNITNETISTALHMGLKFYTVHNTIFKKSVTYFNLNYEQVLNLYTNQTLNTTTGDETVLREFFGTVSTHALFDKSIVKSHPFRVSLFDCPPYVKVYNAEKKE